MSETPPKAPAAKPKHQDSLRDTIESILFAFVLAFLFRTFEAEAFVIPTGSMAPTLYGRHKETTCPSCGYHVAVGASDEVDSKTGYLEPGHRLKVNQCANCGFQNEKIFSELAFNGDRILVNKFTYEFSKPQRWDVFVFKFPEEPGTNYIKRLVGLPGETIRIRSGNLYQWDGERETILRKDHYKQSVLQIPVYDDAHPSKMLQEAGWPERWAAVRPSQDVHAIGGWHDDREGWTTDSKSRTYTISSDAARELRWLRYRHLLPSQGDWLTITSGGNATPRARLIGDFCGYNAFPNHWGQVDEGWYWVPDLTLNCQVTIDRVNENGQLILELTEGVSRYRCRIQVTTGDVILEEVNDQLEGRVKELARGKSKVSGPGKYRLSFANVDDRLCLWVNRSVVEFGEGAELNVSGATSAPLPTVSDLCPVGIAAEQVSATVSNLLIERDIYYRGNLDSLFERNLAERVYDPAGWAEWYLDQRDEVDFMELVIPEGHYLALGDNSPRSRDSRYWAEDMQTVPEKFLVGKAFWIYWPHGVPFLNGGRGFPVWSHYQRQGGQRVTVDDYPKYTLPFYPQFARMKRIR